jgi:transposase
LRNNPVLAAWYAHLTARADNRLTRTQARVAVSGSLLRQLHAVLTTGTAWDPAIAGGLTLRAMETAPAG